VDVTTDERIADALDDIADALASLRTIVLWVTVLGFLGAAVIAFSGG